LVSRYPNFFAVLRSGKTQGFCGDLWFFFVTFFSSSSSDFDSRHSFFSNSDCKAKFFDADYSVVMGELICSPNP